MSDIKNCGLQSSYGVEIKKKNIPLRSTLDIFRKAVSYLIPVYAETWEELSEIRNPQKRFNEAERSEEHTSWEKGELRGGHGSKCVLNRRSSQIRWHLREMTVKQKSGMILFCLMYQMFRFIKAFFGFLISESSSQVSAYTGI